MLFLNDTDQPQVADELIGELKALIKGFNVQSKFGLHLIHGHLKMDKGMVMMGKPMANLPGHWVRPTKVEQLHPESLHGHIFALDADGMFYSYEFRQGPAPPITDSDNEFIIATQRYLEQHNLQTIIGIELLAQDTLGQWMKEFVLSHTDGTVMLPANAANPTETYRITGWNAVEGILDLKGSESAHQKTTKGTHQVFTDGKGLPGFENDAYAEEVITEGLREAGIIN